jgi:AsmA protein
VDLLRSLDLAGALGVGPARLAVVDLTNGRVAVPARDGKVRLSPSEARLFGGSYAGEVDIDATGPVPRLALNERLNSIDFAQLFATLLESDRVSGKGSATARVTATGRTTDAMLRSLSGTMNFEVADGALEGLDLWYEIRRAQALLEREAVPAREGPARTPFRALEASGEIRDGVLATDDLEAALDYLRVDGRGTVDLVERELDYALRVRVLDAPPAGADAAAMQNLVRAEIPVSVSGPFSDLAVRPDVESYVQGRAQQALQEEAEELVQKLEQKLGDKLRGILGGDR